MPILFSNVRVSPSLDPASGGAPFECHAPQPGFVLVGLHARVGDWIDQVAPIWAELLDDGSIGQELHGPSYGGVGGGARELRVRPGHVVTGIQTRSGHYLDGFRLAETRWDGALSMAETGWTPWLVGATAGGVERPERLAAPVGRAVVVGIAGRAGRYVDNLTVITADLQRVAATAIGHGSGRATASAALG